MTTGTGSTLNDLRKQIDPMYVGDSPVPVFKFRGGKAKTLLIVAAQNATPVHKDWWRVINVIADERGAEIVVLPIRYKNPTSSWTGSQKNAEHWVEEVRPYLCSERVTLNENLMLLGDIKIQPTAADPLTGFESVSRASSAVVAHTKIQTRTIATPQNRMAKILMTSGACTVQNYSDTRAGRVGEFHHSLSCVLVELVSGKRFHMRRIHFDERSKSATDAARGERYTVKGPEIAPRALGLITGDWHDPFTSPGVIKATFGAGGMVEAMRPESIVYHDSTDGYAVNPHHAKNPFNRIAKYENDADSARDQLESLRQFLISHTVKDTQNVVVTSNHDDFLSRYIVNADWREDPANAEWYLETALHMVRNTRLDKARGTVYPNAFTWWMRRFEIPQTRILDEDESFMLASYECGMHGNRGPNGARGSIRNLRRIGVKSITGHVHSPGEDEGATQVGSMFNSAIGAEYRKGPSSWLQANCFVNDDGKRQLALIVNGRFHN